MKSDLSSLGYGSQKWYMVEAVQAHENVHVTEYESSYNNTFSNVKSGTEALTTPFQCGDTIAAAKQRMQSAATAVFNNGNTTASNAYAAIPDPNAQTDAAEHAIVDPVVAGINSKASANHWTACP